MRKSVPDEGLMLRNSFFHEPEDAFDLKEDEKPLSLEFFDPAPRPHFADDIMYPNQLIKLPIRVDMT
jgi:hypothetical protein